MTFDLTAHGAAIERDGYTIIEDFLTPARPGPARCGACWRSTSARTSDAMLSKG